MRYSVNVIQGNRSEKLVFRKLKREELNALGFVVPDEIIGLRVFDSDITLPKINVAKGTEFVSSGKVEKVSAVTDFIIIGPGGRAIFNQVVPPLEFACRIDSY